MTDNWQPEIIGGWTVPETEIDRLRAENAALKAALDEAERGLGDIAGGDLDYGDEPAAVCALHASGVLARIRALKERVGEKPPADRVQAAYDRLYAERTAEDPEAKSEFNNGILAGMTELLNAIRADG